MAVTTADATAKRYRRGTHRVCSPQETFDRVRTVMPRLGITRVADITGLDVVGVPVFVAVRPGSRGLTTSQGKGMDVAAARTSALMESVEGWHGERARTTGPYARTEEAQEALGIPALDLARLPRRGQDTTWTTRSRIAWCTGTNLLDGTPRLVPLDAVSSDFTEWRRPSPLVRTTNGLASGNCREEAALHGLYEVLERDAVSAWSATAGTHDRVIDPASLGSGDEAELVDRLARAGLDVSLLWVPSETGLPIVAATVAPTTRWRHPPYAAFAGYGAHLDPRVALSRALTEAVQSRLAFIHGSRDDLWPSHYARVLDHRAAGWWAQRVASVEPTHTFAALPDLSTPSLRDDLRTVLDLVRPTLPEVVEVELDDPDIGVAVSKVVVPGLFSIPFDERPRDGGRTDPGADR